MGNQSTTRIDYAHRPGATDVLQRCLENVLAHNEEMQALIQDLREEIEGLEQTIVDMAKAARAKPKPLKLPQPKEV